MCGLTGFIQWGGVNAGEARQIGMRMSDTLVHRGPDDSGIWIDEMNGVVFAFRRLSIIDLSSAGHQPMVSASGRYIVVFNGEIYNHLKLREELSHSTTPFWRGNSDTETLLACIERWGFSATLKKLVGMFGIALWDKAKRTLYLARDRMGEKPLYYGWQNNSFLFGSELKALKVHPAFSREIDRDALCLLLRHNYIPAPYSIYKGIQKLTPGTYLTIPFDVFSGNRCEPKPITYWSMSEVAAVGQNDPFPGEAQEAVEALDHLLRESVRNQMVADVPLGAFLSGGIDSSTIVALMQEQSGHPVKTFTIGFKEKGYNEAPYAKEVARHLGTDHTELYVSAKQALEVIPRLPTLYDEPFSDSSQLPTFLISQMTRRHVTVSLSGDGGDELFGGYPRYFLAKSIWNICNAVPRKGHQLFSSIIRSLPVERWNRIGAALHPVLPSRLRERPVGDRAYNLIEISNAFSTERFYQNHRSHWKNPSEVVLKASEPSTVLTRKNVLPELSFEHSMMFLDTISYLPDDILLKVDRAAMGVGLETRVPLLDHRVVEFAWRLPLTLKIRNGQGKWILKQVLYRYVPKAMIERPKMGFGLPIDVWLRGPLRDWAECLLDEQRIRREGFFNPKPIREKWTEHLGGERNWHYYLWDVLMFQAWLELEKRL